MGHFENGIAHHKHLLFMIFSGWHSDCCADGVMKTAQPARRVGRGLLGLLVLGALIAAAGCVTSPVPQPPPLELDVTLVTAPGCPDCGGLTIEGSPGAVIGDLGVPGSVPQAVIWIVNLDTTSQPVIEPLAEDGSFEVTPDGSSGDTFRLQARTEDERTEPVDIEILDDNQIALVEHPLDGCLSIEPPLELDFESDDPGSRRQVVIASTCGDELLLEPPRLRAPNDGFGIEGELSRLGSGEDATLTVEYSDTAPNGVVEEIFFIEVSSPERDRRAITLIAGED